MPRLDKPVIRETVYPAPSAQLWDVALVVLSASKAIVRTADKASGLITYSQVIEDEKAKGVILELSRDQYKQVTAHTTLLIKPVRDRQTKLYAYTKFIMAERVLNSNGRAEEEITVRIIIGPKNWTTG